ncbi:hypothetical protein FITA111629_00380 [Filibacter tadaridae]|uniref:Uncharacterized protein n=1 Tax=Filibacter tadaridae TaxID=2483811 RepID=A0A3P5X477_9BACL|nr:hypothetical protein FILTAD_01925 [Filibacter tadaridae]
MKKIVRNPAAMISSKKIGQTKLLELTLAALCKYTNHNSTTKWKILEL